MFGIGFTEIILILGIALIFIGPKNLPDLAKSMGKGYVEFMRAFREMQKSINDDVLDIQKTLDPTPEIFGESESNEREDKTGQKRTERNHQNKEGDNKGE